LRIARVLFQPHIDVVAFVAIDYLPGATAAEPVADQIHNLIHTKTVATESVAVRGDDKLGFTGYLLQLHVGGALHFLHGLGDGFAFVLQHAEIRPEQLDGQLRFYPGKQLVHAHGDGLGKVEQQAGVLFQFLLNLFL